jgi:tRNA-specific 2-thiouridylase
VINCRALFEQKVIRDFCRNYKNGQTPNPCIRCNQLVKFEYLLRQARKMGATYLATGHYAKIKYDCKNKVYHLVKAKDPRKDQSYFLYTLTQGQLKYILFPLGKHTKTEVRALAQKIGLPTAHRPESQEICFIPDNDYHRFLKEKIGRNIRPGSITDTTGKRLGTHQGLPFYTIGQRKGLGIAAAHPLYVKAINKKKNILMVAPEREIYQEKLIADKIILATLKNFTAPIKVKAKIRSAHKEAQCIIAPLGKDKVKVEFTARQWAITPGQAIVFYKGNKILGGGTILKAVDSSRQRRAGIVRCAGS